MMHDNIVVVFFVVETLLNHIILHSRRGVKVKWFYRFLYSKAIGPLSLSFHKVLLTGASLKSATCPTSFTCPMSATCPTSASSVSHDRVEAIFVFNVTQTEVYIV